MKNYNDAHRLFLQVFVSKKFLTEKDTETVYSKVCERMEVETPDKISDFIHTINKELIPLFMEIRNGRAEDTGIRYYALVNSLEDEAAKFATDFTAQEIEFIKKAIEVIIISPEGTASSTDLINLSHDLPKKLSVQAAEELLTRLTSRSWLTQSKGDVSFGPRGIIELGQYLEEKFTDHVSVCVMCHTVVIMGEICTNCATKVHKYCASTRFRGLPVEKRTCPSCKKPWEDDVAMLQEENNDMPEDVKQEEELDSSSSSTRRSRRQSKQR